MDPMRCLLKKEALRLAADQPALLYAQWRGEDDAAKGSTASVTLEQNMRGCDKLTLVRQLLENLIHEHDLDPTCCIDSFLELADDDEEAPRLISGYLQGETP